MSNQVPKCFCVEVTPEMNVAKWQQAAAATAIAQRPARPISGSRNARAKGQQRVVTNMFSWKFDLLNETASWKQLISPLLWMPKLYGPRIPTGFAARITLPES